MRVFLTGAAGSSTTALAAERLQAGHSVLPHKGPLADHAGLITGALACDGVTHEAVIPRGASDLDGAESERRAIEAMLAALEGSGKPFVATSGLEQLAEGRLATEADRAPPVGRGASEVLVLQAAHKGIRSLLVRLPPAAHGAGDGGFIPHLIDIARRTGVAAFVAAGENRWAAGRSADAARLCRLALERGAPGATYHAVGEEGAPTRDLAAAVGWVAGAPTASLGLAAAQAHFGWICAFLARDMAASSVWTHGALGGRPTPPGLLADLWRPNSPRSSKTSAS